MGPNSPNTLVHICVLHRLVNIIEKLVYAIESERTIKNIEQMLSNVGLHRVQVKIEKYLERSGKIGNVPCKP